MMGVCVGNMIMGSIRIKSVVRLSGLYTHAIRLLLTCGFDWEKINLQLAVILKYLSRIIVRINQGFLSNTHKHHKLSPGKKILEINVTPGSKNTCCVLSNIPLQKPDCHRAF
jgi:hypothetical protein